MMKCEFEGRKYEIRFRHEDQRWKKHVPEDGGKPWLSPRTVKEIKKLGGNRTTARILDITNPEGEPIVLAAATVRHHLKADAYNKAHARWYALERALSFVSDLRLVRALRKAYYAGTSWRPDGRDGFKIQMVERKKGGLSGGVYKELVRCHAER